MIDISLNPVTNVDVSLDSVVNFDISLFSMSEMLDYELDHVEEFETDLSSSDNLEVDMAAGVIINPEYPMYEGPYISTPKTHSQVYETKEKAMSDDFTVLEIPYQEVSNPQGGKTVVIAYE